MSIWSNWVGGWQVDFLSRRHTTNKCWPTLLTNKSLSCVQKVGQQCQCDLIGGWLTGWFLSNTYFIKRHFSKYNRSEVETLHIGTVWWEADAGADPGGVQVVRTPALCLGCPVLKRTYFQNMLFLAEQGASRLMIFEQRCAFLINFRIKFNLIFACAPSIHSLVTVLSMLLFNTNSNVIYTF